MNETSAHHAAIESPLRSDMIEAESCMKNAAPNSIPIWLIEDNNAFRGVIQRVIDDIPGFVCAETFASCEDALEALTGSQPKIILLDVELPGMNGITGIREIKKRAPNTHVVMLTVFDDQQKIRNAITAGASGYLLKTSSEEEIAAAMREVVDGGVPMNKNVARSVWTMFAQMSAPQESYGLTPREKEILKGLVDGKVNKEIAEKLSMSYHTVDAHLRNIYEKLKVHNRAGAVAKAVHEHLV